MHEARHRHKQGQSDHLWVNILVSIAIRNVHTAARGYCDAHTHETRNADISASISLKGSTGAWRRANTNEVATDEELIEGLSLPLYRRIATLIFLPADAGQQSGVDVDPADLAAAHQRDQAA